MDIANSVRRSTAPTMRAAVLVRPGAIELVEVAVPAPGHGEVRIRLEGCGICGSNLPTWEGRPWFQYPFTPGAPGHEGWGVVDAVGAGVKGLAEGDRVACLGGAAFAEAEVAPASSVVALPPSLAGVPFPGEPLACAVNVFRRSDVQSGMTVAVLGVGFLGAVLVRLAADAGARVVAITRRTFALEVARRMGAHACVPLADPGATTEAARAAIGGALFDRTIEAAGVQETLTLAGDLTRERGRVVIAGYHQDGARSVNMQLWNWRGLDVINAHERDPAVYTDGMRRAVDLVASGRLDPAPLYTHRFQLARLADAFEAARTRPDGFMKALVTTR